MGEEGKVLGVVVADSNIIHCTRGNHIIRDMMVRSYALTLAPANTYQESQSRSHEVPPLSL